MVSVIGGILPYAVVVAVCPVPIIGILLLLVSKRAKSNSISFFIGWVITLIVVGTIVLLVADSDTSTGSEPSTTESILRFVFGVVLLLLAGREWRKRPKKGETPKSPRWLSFVDSFTPVKSFGLAVVLVGLNFKSLAAILSAAVKIEKANLSDGESVISMGVFVVISSTTVGMPMALYLLKGEEILKSLQKWRRWIEKNSFVMLFTIELLVGVIFTGQGIGVFPT